MDTNHFTLHFASAGFHAVQGSSIDPKDAVYGAQEHVQPMRSENHQAVGHPDPHPETQRNVRPVLVQQSEIGQFPAKILSKNSPSPQAFIRSTLMCSFYNAFTAFNPQQLGLCLPAVPHCVPLETAVAGFLFEFKEEPLLASFHQFHIICHIRYRLYHNEICSIQWPCRKHDICARCMQPARCRFCC